MTIRLTEVNSAYGRRQGEFDARRRKRHGEIIIQVQFAFSLQLTTCRCYNQESLPKPHNVTYSLSCAKNLSRVLRLHCTVQSRLQWPHILTAIDQLTKKGHKSWRRELITEWTLHCCATTIVRNYERQPERTIDQFLFRSVCDTCSSRDVINHYEISDKYNVDAWRR